MGNNKGPFCPQPIIAVKDTRQTPAVTKIDENLDANMTVIVMTDPEYQTHAERLLATVESCCDQLNEATDADIDNQRSGGMVTLTLANRSQLVVNLQKPLHEVWLAAKSGGYHYKFHGAHWRDTKTDAEFWAQLTRCASEQAGQNLVFAPEISS
jgi:CyaY protein